MKYPDSRLLILSKAPVPGRVKTRLVPLLGEQGAAELYARLLHTTLQCTTTAGLCPVSLCCSPSASHPFFEQCRRDYDIALMEQSSGDLGTRMASALQQGLVHAGSVLLIGGDCPDLQSGDLEAALAALSAGDDIVIGPAEDGGYYLIGLRQHQPGLFTDIAWGTPAVLTQTRQRMRELGLRSHSLPVRRDLDTPEDYALYTGGCESSQPRVVEPVKDWHNSE